MAIVSNVSHLVYIILSPVVSTLFVVLNMLSIVVFVRKFRLASLSLVILVNICVCDILVCLVSNNFYVGNLLHPTYAWATGAMSCKLFKTLTMMCNLAQIYSFAVLCVDRMRRLIETTRKQWNKSHGIVFLVAIWALCCSISGGRIMLFDEKTIQKRSNVTNLTETINIVCKPSGMKTFGYTLMTIVQFIAGYLLPLLVIIATIITCQLHLHRDENIKMLAQINSPTRSMNRQLSMVFNLTALLFMLVWTPFFVMSVIDLNTNLLNNKALTHLNFSFRCTLLVVGSGKPLIYMLGLKRYRKAMCGGICGNKDRMYKEDRQATSSSNVSESKGCVVSPKIPIKGLVTDTLSSSSGEAPIGEVQKY